MSNFQRSSMEVHSFEDESSDDIKVEDFIELLAALQSIPPVTLEDVSRREEAVPAGVRQHTQPQFQQQQQQQQHQQQRTKKTESDTLRNVQDAPRTVGQTNDKTVRRKKEQLLTVFAEFVNLTTLVNQDSNRDGSFPRHEAVLVIMNQVKDPPTCGGRNTTDELLRREKVELIAMGAGNSTAGLKRIFQNVNRAEDSETKDQYDFRALLHDAETDIRASTKEYISNKSQKRRRGKRDKSRIETTTTTMPVESVTDNSDPTTTSSRPMSNQMGSAAVSPLSLEEPPKDIRNPVLLSPSPRKRKSL